MKAKRKRAPSRGKAKRRTSVRNSARRAKPVPSVATFESQLGRMAAHEGLDIRALARKWRGEMRDADDSRGGWEITDLLREISRTLRASGVVSIHGTRAEMVNMGDLYTPTVIYDYGKGRFFITDESTYREKNEKPGASRDDDY